MGKSIVYFLNKFNPDLPLLYTSLILLFLKIMFNQNLIKDSGIRLDDTVNLIDIPGLTTKPDKIDVTERNARD